jgi:hypothetical protein
MASKPKCGRSRAKNFYQRVQVDEQTEVVIHVNRRGCKGPWTKADDEAMQALVRAANAQFGARSTTSGN